MSGIKKEVQIGNCRLLLGDCLEIMPELGKVELIHTDPPFGVGNFVQTSGKITGRGSGRGKPVEWNDTTPSGQVFDIMRRISRHRIIWGANFFNCFEPDGGAIIWDKSQKVPNFSKADIASCTHYKKTEIVRIPWTNFTAAHKADSDHPCERPVALYEWALGYIPDSFGLVLDPFMGSGTTLVACAKTGRSGIGIEIDPDYFEISCRRVYQAYRQPDMFIDPPAPPPVQEPLL